MNSAVIGVGSNINPSVNIESSIDLLSAYLKIIKISEILKTDPVNRSDQPDYLNCAFLIETSLNRHSTNNLLKNIEMCLGRKRTADRYSPRTIDLDIVVWNGEIIDKDFYQRDFLKKSVLQVFPELNY